MARAITLGQRSRMGMDGNSLHMRDVMSARQFDPNMNRFMRDARLAGVLAVIAAAPPAEIDSVEPEFVNETISKAVGEKAMDVAVVLDTDVSEEMIEEINASVSPEPAAV